MGLGYGAISFSGKDWDFIPATSIALKIFGQDKRLDAFVNKDGKPLVHTSRSGLRPFNKDELNRIIQVGLCLPCHNKMTDPVMKNWKGANPPVPCQNFIDIFKVP